MAEPGQTERLTRLPFAPGAAARLQISFEFFPPKTPAAADHLFQSITQLQELKPSFVSVTYGAGGSTRERTHNTVTRIQRETPLQAAAHLTCVAATRQEVDQVARHIGPGPCAIGGGEIGETVEHPTAFPVAGQQPGLGQ